MQIIITQSEIESAIRTYIMEQVSVKPGMTITIDLKATRGAEGATAIIDIVAIAGATNPFKAIVPIEEPKKKEAAAELVMPGGGLAHNPVKAVVEAVPEALIPENEVVEPAVQEPVVETPVVPARTSLFSNLKKPVNV